MQVEATIFWGFQDRLGQYLAIGGDNGHIRPDGRKAILFVCVFQRKRRYYLKTRLFGEIMDRRQAFALAAPGGTRRLRVYAHDLMARAHQL